MIIVIVFLFLLYLNTTVNDESPQQRLLESKLRAKTFELYVQSCLHTAVEESVAELGAAGGYVLVASPFAQGGRSFLLQKNGAILPPPWYPCISQDCTITYDPNVVCTTARDHCRFSLDPPLAESLLLPLIGPRSLTTQLVTLAEQKISGCVDLGQNVATVLPLTIRAGDPTLIIRHETQSIFLDLAFPFTLTTEGGEESQTFSYQATLPLRLRLFYAFLEELLYRDSSDLGFRVDQDFITLTSYFEGFNVTVDRTSYSPYDLITVTDTASGSTVPSLSFVFLRENLAPSLNYISSSPDGTSDLVLQQGASGSFILIPLLAYDPNEDSVSYTIEPNSFATIAGSSLTIDTSRTGTASFKVMVSDSMLNDYQVVRLAVR